MTQFPKHQRNELATLAEWAATCDFTEIPHSVLQRALLIIADDAACAIGAGTEWCPRYIAGQSHEATILMPGNVRADRFTAAMHNAIRANWTQLDEGHRSVMCHAGLYTVPAALAEAEANDLTLADVLRAVVLGYEVVCRFALSWRFPTPRAHPHAMWSALGAAAAIAAIRKYDHTTYLSAIFAASTSAMAGPFSHATAGATIANAWCGLGVGAGFRCADWALEGLSGSASSPHETFGGALQGNFVKGQLEEALGASWAMHGNYHKVYACAQQTHAAVEAVLKLRDRAGHDIRERKVGKFVIEAHALALTLDNRSPTTSLGARFSLPHIAATAWVLGPEGLTSLITNSLHDPQIAEVRRLIELRKRLPVLPAPHDRAATVTIELHGREGMRAECLSARGGPDQPLTESDILAKCHALADPHFASFFTAVENVLPAIPTADMRRVRSLLSN